LWAQTPPYWLGFRTLSASAEFSGCSVEFLAVVANAGDQVPRLLLGEAMFPRELADLIILVGRHTAAVGLANLGLIVGHEGISSLLEEITLSCFGAFLAELTSLAQLHCVDPPLNFHAQCEWIGVSKANQKRLCLSERLPVALYRILRCEPWKPNLIDRDPRPYQCFVGT